MAEKSFAENVARIVGLPSEIIETASRRGKSMEVKLKLANKNRAAILDFERLIALTEAKD